MCYLKWTFLAVLLVLVQLVSFQNCSYIFDPSGFKGFRGEVNVLYSNTISKAKHHVYQYRLNESTFNNTSDAYNANLRVYAEVEAINDDLTRNCPLHFTIRQRQDVKAWELPVFSKAQNTSIYRRTERTLCVNAGEMMKEDDLIIMISTCSNQPFKYFFEVSVTFDIFISANTEVIKSVALFSPSFYRFKYLSADGSKADSPVIVTASSDDETCMILSIQSPHCPVLDDESTARFRGHWQTVSTKAGITVPRGVFPDGFFIVLVILSDDEACEEYKGIVPPTIRKNYWKQRTNNRSSFLRNKTISLYVRSVMGETKYLLPVLLPLTFYFALILTVLLNFVGFHRLQLQIPKLNSKVKLGIKESIVNASDIDEKPVVTCKSRLRATVFISDFVKADYKSLQKKSKQYFWSVTTVAIFYCSPVVQLIFNYVKVLHRTGEHDLCYYNFLCAHPYKNIMDFNHLYSNIGYVILGLTFMLFVKASSKKTSVNKDFDMNTSNILAKTLRHESLKEASEFTNQQLQIALSDRYKINPSSWWRKLFPSTEERLDHGVLQHFGLFYAMGVALVMEGLLSGCYHLCPSRLNFQYDTSFMYVIAVLAIVKVYQFRHPVNVNANILILILALVSIYTMLGLLFENLIFKAIFTVAYVVFIFNILTYLYYVGYLKNQYDEVVTNWLDVYKYVFSKWLDDLRLSRKTGTRETDSNIIQLKLGPNRLLLPVLSVLSNGTIIVMIWTVMDESNFATQVLAMLIVNLVLYTFYYAVMKNIHDEYEGKVWLQTLVYAILAVVLWVFSLNYFRQAATSWEKSPAESKVQNKDCFFMDFYDEHDMWHFLSAGAMFCSFMVLLTLDDDLIFTPQSKIPVF